MRRERSLRATHVRSGRIRRLKFDSIEARILRDGRDLLWRVGRRPGVAVGLAVVVKTRLLATGMLGWVGRWAVIKLTTRRPWIETDATILLGLRQRTDVGGTWEGLGTQSWRVLATGGTRIVHMVRVLRHVFSLSRRVLLFGALL